MHLQAWKSTLKLWTCLSLMHYLLRRELGELKIAVVVATSLPFVEDRMVQRVSNMAVQFRINKLYELHCPDLMIRLLWERFQAREGFRHHSEDGNVHGWVFHFLSWLKIWFVRLLYPDTLETQGHRMKMYRSLKTTMLVRHPLDRARWDLQKLHAKRCDIQWIYNWFNSN